MYGSLLYAHVEFYCMENLHYCVLECVRECCNYSITSCPPVVSLVAIKGGREVLARSTNVYQPLFILGVLALTLLKFV